MIRRSARNDPSAGCVTLDDLIKEEQEKLNKEEKSLGELLEDCYFVVCLQWRGVGDQVLWQKTAEKFLQELAKK